MQFSGAFGVLEIVGIIFLLIIVAETLWDFWSGRRKQYGETSANFAIAFGNMLLERSVYGLVFIVGLFAVEAVSVFSLPITWWSWMLCLLAADFMYYWMHRWEHEVRIFWAHHSVHHSSPEYNLTTSMRLSWIDSLVEWIFFAPMIVIGFDPVQALICISVVVIYQTWIHTEKIGKLGWLDGFLNTPSVHRVHHGSNGDYLDKNYGGILIVWDRLFNTYQKEEEPVVYGVTEPIETVNPIKINFHEYGEILKDLMRAKRFSAVLGYVFGRPGWRPNDQR